MDKPAKTRRRIISSARDLFLVKGLNETSMGDIAEKAECHRRTLYRYFPRKEDLVYETVISLIEDMNENQREVYPHLTGTGREKFVKFLKEIAKYMEERRSMVRFMGEFDFFFRDDSPYRPGQEISEHFEKVIHITEEILGLIIEEGKRDRSINLPYPENVFIPTVTGVLWGMAQRIAIREGMIEEEFAVSGMDMVNVQIDIYGEVLNPSSRMN